MRKTKIARRKNQSRKKVLVLAAVIIVGLLLVSGLTAHAQKWWPFQSDTPTAAKSQSETGQSSPSNHSQQTKSDPKSSNVSTGTSEQVPVSQTLSASITQLVESGDAVLFTGKVQNATDAGTCVVTFTNPGDRPLTEQVTASYANSVSTCGQISIPAIEFTALGTWNASFHYYSGGQQVAAEGTIDIR